MLNPVFGYPGALFWPKGVRGFGSPVVSFGCSCSNRGLTFLWDVPELDSRGYARNRAGILGVRRLWLDNPLKVKSLPALWITSHSLTGKQELNLLLPEGNARNVATFVPRIPVNRLRAALSRFRFRVLFYLFARFSPGLAKSIKNAHEATLLRKAPKND